MRFSGFGNRRNIPQRVSQANPLPRYDDATHSGDAGKDGFAVAAKAEPDYAGKRPFVEGTEGFSPQGPDQSFEQ